MKNVINLFKQKKYKNEGNSNRIFEFSSILISQKKKSINTFKYKYTLRNFKSNYGSDNLIFTFFLFFLQWNLIFVECDIEVVVNCLFGPIKIAKLKNIYFLFLNLSRLKNTTATWIWIRREIYIFYYDKY